MSATLEITSPPRIDELYFFALQATFTDRGADRGGAHVGLQWNPRFPANQAANWGGYDDRGQILSGTPSDLPSTPNDPNTRDFAWEGGRPYRLTIGPVVTDDDGQRWWPGSVTDLTTGRRSEIRRLGVDADMVRAPVVWMEVFAPCDAPAVVAAWSDLRATTTDGTEVEPRVCRTAYQGIDAGGCTNTTSASTNDSFVQRTNTSRLTPADTLLSLD